MITLSKEQINADFTDEDIIRIGLGLADGSMTDEQLLDLILERSK